MPSKRRQLQKKNRERYEKSKSDKSFSTWETDSVNENGGETPVKIPFSPKNGSQSTVTGDVAMGSPETNQNMSISTTPSVSLSGMVISTPQHIHSSMSPPQKKVRIESISSEMSYVGSTDSSINSCPSKGGRPRKRKGGPGRPKKQKQLPSTVPYTTQFSLHEPLDGTPDAEKHTTSKVQNENTETNDFGHISSINFATSKNTNALIWKKADMNLYSLDASGNEPAFGTRIIEQMWNNLDAWLDDKFIFAYLCLLAKNSTRKVVVVDSLITDPRYTNIDCPVSAIHNACYNFDSCDLMDVVLFPMFFPVHWALIIHDREVGTFFVDSLARSAKRLDQSYPNYDHRRIPLVDRIIKTIFPDLMDSNINIISLDQNQISQQSDYVSCGYFVCFFAEAWLFNGHNLILEPMSLNAEKKRILWHINELYSTDDVVFHSRYALPQSINSTPIFGQNPFSNIMSTPIKSKNVDLPKLNLTPIKTPIVSPQLSPSQIRRSPRLLSRSTSRSSEASDTLPSTTKTNPITQRCKRKHEDIPCADVRAQHTPTYYDSGNPGDSVCEHCNAQLLNSEVDKRRSSEKKVISSYYCCYNGKVHLQPYQNPPPLLFQLSRGNTQESKEFLKNQNIYNSLLSFASVQVGQSEATIDGGHLFLLNGVFNRQISSIMPGAHVPSFSQLYILDPLVALDHRTKNQYGGERVDPTTLQKLDLMIRENNPLCKELNNFHQQYRKTLDQYGPDAVLNYRLTLLEERETPRGILDPNLHKRQTNIPTERESLFAIWAESDYPPFQKGIWISTCEDELRHFLPHHPMTDSLCYPLLFPCGDDGFHKQIPIVLPKDKAQIFNNDDDNESLPVSDNESESYSDIDSNISDTPSTDNLQNTNKKRKFISSREYARYRLALRNSDYHHIWSAGGGLSQKFVLDYAARIDSDLATWLRRPELDLRSTLPENALRWLAKYAGLNSTDELGSIVMFRENHPGTRPYFQDMFYDSTCIMSRVRDPKYAWFMLTFTSNPHWPEITRNKLRIEQKVVDRPDLLCRIYEDKLRYLYYLLEDKHILGKISGFGESREYQKRGGPHLHRVFQSDILAIPECIENIIWAHIPPEPPTSDQSAWANFIRKVRFLIPKYQVHDCGEHCKNHQGRCSKRFPQPFSKQTILFEDKPALYYRPSPADGGETLTVKQGRIIRTYDNSRIVAYNPFLLVSFEVHHNIEFAYGRSSHMKYALKYPFKGPAFSYVKSTQDGKTNVDEPAYYAKMLFRQPAEAYSRLMSYKYARLSHTVHKLRVHLPGKQRVFIPPGKQQQILLQLQNGWLPETPLTAYWKKWETDPELKNILFEQMPERFILHKTSNSASWSKRKRGEMQKPSKRKRDAKKKPIIGRIIPVSPRDPELFALYLLIKHFPGNDQFLKTVPPNSHQCDTFLEAAKLRGLIEDQDIWIKTLEEAAHSLIPKQMRQLFVNILCFGSTENCLIDGKALWEQFQNQFYYPCPPAQVPGRIDRALAIIERLLIDQGRTCSDFGLPTPINSILNDVNQAVNNFFFPTMHLNDDEDDTDDVIDTNAYNQTRLNPGQRAFFDLIVDRANTPPEDQSDRLFRLVGDGGTGKTFTLNFTLFQLRTQGKKVLPSASTGIASTKFYSGGMTTHSTFRFGIDVEPGKLPSIPLDSFFARRLIEADLIIIDEYTSLHKIVLENIDALLRLMVPRYKNTPFGGKVVILSGDWQQTLPVVIYGGPDAQVAACIQSSHLYQLFRPIKLTQNMRVDPRDIEFLNFLKLIGTGATGDEVPFPPNMVLKTREEVQQHVFDKGFAQPTNELLKRLVLASTNRVVDINNIQMTNTLKSKYFDYFSIDTPTDENPLAINAADFDIAQLNQFNPPGMPAHHIKLKIGTIVVLLVNLNTKQHLCNGTRMIVRKCSPNLIEAETVTGGSSRTGVLCGIPRVRTTWKSPRPDEVSFERLQFPVKIAHCMTINKAQGQTVERLGLDFTDDPFAHGQLYTSVSRGTAMEGIRIYAPKKPIDSDGNVLIRNVVARGIQFD